VSHSLVRPVGRQAFAIVSGAVALLLFTPSVHGQRDDDERLNFVLQPPPSVEVGETFAVAVEVLDDDGDRDDDHKPEIIIALEGETTARLSGTTSRKVDADGLAVFDDLSIDQAGIYRLIVTTGGGVRPDTSDSFVVLLRPTATRLEFVQEPTGAQAGAMITPAVTVRAANDLDATDTSFEGAVTIAIGTNPGGGTLSGTTTVTAVDGVATFGDLAIDRAGSGYTLAATAGGLSSATSDPFDITPGVASRLAFDQQPTDTEAGEPVTPPVTVRVEDASGNLVTTFSGSVTIFIGTNPSAGSLKGATTVAAFGGVATFSDLAIDKPGAGYTLVATSGALADDTSESFEITSVGASRLEFVQPPSETPVGAPIAPAVVVAAVDGAGRTDTSFAGNVTIAIGTNPAGGTLSGTTTVAAVDGVATFGDLVIDRIGGGYTLAATAGGLSGATSDPFDVTPRPASGLTSTITADPTSVPADGASTSTITVIVNDDSGSRRTSGGDAVALTTTAGTLGVVTDRGDGSYTAALRAPSSPAAATIRGTVNGTVISGTATVTFLGTSGSAVASTRLVFSVEPSDALVHAPIAPSVEVRAVDDAGRIDTSFDRGVTITIGINPAGGSLSANTTVRAVRGVATFGDLAIDRPGSGYTLVATAVGLTGATSGAFSVLPEPVSVSGATSTVAAFPTEIPADGTSTSTITVQLRAADGTPFFGSGSDVRLTTTAGTLGPVTNQGNGRYTATLTAPSTPATATIRGTVNGQSIAQTTTVELAAVATDLEITAAVSDPTPRIGETILYAITVSNRGPARATGVMIDYALAERLTYVSAEATQGSYDPQEGVWSVGVLEPDTSATLEVTVRVER
jgi:uncharacterized repeat protein (TIGR01451 family)